MKSAVADPTPGSISQKCLTNIPSLLFPRLDSGKIGLENWNEDLAGFAIPGVTPFLSLLDLPIDDD